MSTDSPTTKQRAARAEILLGRITTGEWSRGRVSSVLEGIDTEALRVIWREHFLHAGIFVAGQQIAEWSWDILKARGAV